MLYRCIKNFEIRGYVFKKNTVYSIEIVYDELVICIAYTCHGEIYTHNKHCFPKTEWNACMKYLRAVNSQGQFSESVVSGMLIRNVDKTSDLYHNLFTIEKIKLNKAVVVNDSSKRWMLTLDELVINYKIVK